VARSGGGGGGSGGGGGGSGGGVGGGTKPAARRGHRSSASLRGTPRMPGLTLETAGGSVAAPHGTGAGACWLAPGLRGGGGPSRLHQRNIREVALSAGAVDGDASGGMPAGGSGGSVWIASGGGGWARGCLCIVVAGRGFCSLAPSVVA
jgi:hypothetical protein